MLVADFDRTMQKIGGFEAMPVIAIAVSGGIDSMALLLLAHTWAEKNAGPVIALTVDHGLRSESTMEAGLVSGWCKALRIEHHILPWNASNVTNAIQAQARDARYRLLTGWCKKHHVMHLLTGHHRDDQAETLFFRLARGSNIDGLAAMPHVSVKHGVRMIRPLLGMEKAQLRDFLLQQKQPWAHDASNEEIYYTRNLIRSRLTPKLCEHAAQLAAGFGEIRHHLESKIAIHLPQICDIFAPSYAVLHEQPLRSMPYDVVLRTLSALVQTIGGDPYPPRTEKLARLYEEITAGEVKTKRSFAGCIFYYQPKASHFLVYREAKAAHAPLQLTANQEASWDGRFRVSFEASGKKFGHLTIRALGADGRAKLKNTEKSIGFPGIPAVVLSTLPSFWNLEELISVPHMGYTDPHHRGLRCHARFVPAKALAGAAFFSLNRKETLHADNKEQYA